MVLGIRCFQCKEKLKGWGKGQQHANDTGHTWQPGYYCTDCEEVFRSKQKFERHINQPGVHNKSVPPKAFPVPIPGTSSRTASDLRGIAAPRERSGSETGAEDGSSLLSQCSICKLSFPSNESLEEHFTRTSTCMKCSFHFYSFQLLKDHRCAVMPNPVASSSGASVTGTEAENGSSVGSQCPICKLALESKEALEEHSVLTFTCTKCSIHFYASEVLQGHYRTSSVHPHCRECGAGFLGVAEWATHRARCPPPVAPAAESAQTTSTPRSISGGPSIAPTSTGDSHIASRDDPVLELSEVFSLTSSTPPPNPVTAVIQGTSDSVSDGVDVSASEDIGTPETFVTAKTFVTEKQHSNVRVRQDDLDPPKTEKGKGKALSSNVVSSATRISPTTPKGGAPTAANPPSFHCRSCLADPCVEPVATLCGHIFCHSCIVRELAARMCCPVCQRPFLVRLHVGS